MKPQWAYIWEYGYASSTERMRTPVELTKREFDHWIEDDERSVFLMHVRPIESTRIDRNRVPLRDPRFRMKAVMPEFDAPNDSELRAMYLEYTDPQVRTLILEIVMLRRSIEKFQAWFDDADKNVVNKGDFGGAQGALQRLRHLLRAEKQRAGMQ
ncbi:hypothetical protein WJ99_13685 [Burkholderia ubonensis]|nr:hypothetical protein [Burkholderia ubonensis]KVQ11993.1 hypothetical protein WJ99_13685 [Burkholderia ubonensis]